METRNGFGPDYSLQYKTINIFGEIDNTMALCVIDKLQYLDHQFKIASVPPEERVITLQINSPGGVITDGLAIIDTMHFIDAKIMTVALGQAASMAAVILGAGTKGMRAATQNAEVLLHQPLGGASGQASDIILAAQHIERTRGNINAMLSSFTGRSVEEIARDTDRDNVLSAAQALEYGIIDYVIPSKYQISAKE